MKKLRFALLLLFTINSSQAQLLKQIQKAAQQQALNKTSQKGEEATDKAMEESMNNAIMSYGKNKVDASAVPNSYAFSWKYIMEIKMEDGKGMKMDYLLEPEAPYFAINIGESKGQNMFMIMDAKNNLTITAFGEGKDKMATASKMPDYSEIDKKDTDKSKFTYKTLPNKTFLGYNCKGIQATNEEYDIIFYFTSEAKVSFSDLFKNQKDQKMPDVFTNYFKEGENPLMMDMSMKDLKNKNKITTMKCISLEKNSYVFNKSDYRFM